MERPFKYFGNELELFQKAQNWKKYFASYLRPFISGKVLEVGAGIGANTSILRTETVSSWTCLEPDPELGACISARKNQVQVEIGTIESLSSNDGYDAILYIDVLEHILDDLKELRLASERLNINGSIVVLAPAHQHLFSPFDAAVGHHRRYSRRSLLHLKPDRCTVETIQFLDSAGYFLSLANKILLKQNMPTLSQILFWDRYAIPISRYLDRRLLFRFGKSLVAVFRRRNRV